MQVITYCIFYSCKWLVWYVCSKPKGCRHTYQANHKCLCYNYYVTLLVRVIADHAVWKSHEIHGGRVSLNFHYYNFYPLLFFSGSGETPLADTVWSRNHTSFWNLVGCSLRPGCLKRSNTYVLYITKITLFPLNWNECRKQTSHNH